jgi:hypothetical protein
VSLAILGRLLEADSTQICSLPWRPVQRLPCHLHQQCLRSIRFLLQKRVALFPLRPLRTTLRIRQIRQGPRTGSSLTVSSTMYEPPSEPFPSQAPAARSGPEVHSDPYAAAGAPSDHSFHLLWRVAHEYIRHCRAERAAPDEWSEPAKASPSSTGNIFRDALSKLDTKSSAGSRNLRSQPPPLPPPPRSYWCTLEDVVQFIVQWCGAVALTMTHSLVDNGQAHALNSLSQGDQQLMFLLRACFAPARPPFAPARLVGAGDDTTFDQPSPDEIAN